jgi:hypothetical protein
MHAHYLNTLGTYFCIDLLLSCSCVDVDSEFTVDMLKNEIKSLEGINPEVQRLFLVPRVSQNSRTRGNDPFNVMAPTAPKLKPLGSMSARRLKMKEMSPRTAALQNSSGRGLTGTLLPEQPLFFGEEGLELREDGALIISFGVIPHDMIIIHIDGACMMNILVHSTFTFPLSSCVLYM